MKHFKKLASVLLALVMTLALAVPAMAAGGQIDLSKNAITVTNVKNGAVYSIYKMLDLSVNADQTSYSYTVNEDWENFFASPGAGSEYVQIDSQGYVTWKKDADVEALGKAADAYAASKKLDSVKNPITATGFIVGVVFGDLEPGYYLITSTAGTKVIVATTPSKPNVTIAEKNETPTNEKKVLEDSTNAYDATNDADIGQTVYFQSTITAQAGAENYVFHDKMSKGLSYIGVTGITLNDKDVDSANYTVKTNDLTDGCTFEVSFTQAFCDTLKAEDKIVISYTAKLNGNAVVGLPGNPNESKLEYGESGHTTTTPVSITNTYTWDLDVLKYADGDESSVLADAQFVLLNSEQKKVATVVDGKLTKWADVPDAAAAADGTITWPDNTVLTTDKNGKIEIDGLDADTYYLREIKAPDGYNKLADDIEVVITGATKGEDDTLTYTTVMAKVNNQSGTQLPSTGGMGTTIFYIIGGVLVAAAVVLLVTKKRMNAEK